jgi:hypothetical protein
MAQTQSQLTSAAGTGGGAPAAVPALRSTAGRALPPIEEHTAWPMFARLPVMLSVSVPLRGFKVGHLLSLRPGQTLSSTWPTTEDVSLKTGALRLYWGEFEVIEQKMALRLSRLA